MRQIALPSKSEVTEVGELRDTKMRLSTAAAREVARRLRRRMRGKMVLVLGRPAAAMADTRT